jgi:hypothetical protein
MPGNRPGSVCFMAAMGITPIARLLVATPDYCHLDPFHLISRYPKERRFPRR